MNKPYLFLLASLLIFAGPASAQNFLKNPGFETWNGSQPASWTSTTTTKSTTAHGGSYAAELTNASVFGTAIPGDLSQDTIVVSGSSFSLKGWYEFYPVGGDGLDIYLWIFGPKGIAGIAGSHVIEITGSKSVYTAFAMGIAMLPNTTGDSASVDIETAYGSSGTLHAGTYALFDDFVLDNSVTAVNDNEFAMPSTFSLVQNYPNPFNPTTQIEFTIPERNHVTLKVYIIMAQEVATLIDHNLDRGRYKTAFDGSRLASGMYLYKIQAGSFSQVKKMLLIK